MKYKGYEINFCKSFSFQRKYRIIATDKIHTAANRKRAYLIMKFRSVPCTEQGTEMEEEKC